MSTFTFDTRIGDRELPLRIRRMARQDATRLHDHEFSELAVVCGGEGEHYDGEGRLAKLSRGDVVFVPRGVAHRYGEGDSLSIVNILFEQSSLPMPFLDACAMPGFHFLFSSIRGIPHVEAGVRLFKLQEDSFEELCGVISELERELAERGPGYQFSAISLFMRLCVIFSRLIADGSPSIKSRHSGVAEAMDYLHRHFNGRVEIAKVAAASHMSMSTLLRSFKRVNGCTPKDYLMRLRINCASELLATSDMDIRGVGLHSGFEDANYFSREFRRITKLSPGKYRSLFRAGARKK